MDIDNYTYDFEDRKYLRPEVSRDEQMEAWKDIPGWEGIYQASTLGRIKRLPYTVILQSGGSYHREGHILNRTVPASNGYYMAELRSSIDGGRIERNTFHRIIARTFIPNPNKYEVVNHINGNKLDNRVGNLEWCSYADNLKHAKEVLGHPSGCPAKRVECVEEKMEFESITCAAQWLCQENGYKNLSSAISNIAAAIRGERAIVGGYHWQEKKEEK